MIKILRFNLLPVEIVSCARNFSKTGEVKL